MKKFAIFALLLALMFSLAGCGVAQEDYDAVCAERDALKSQVELLETEPHAVKVVASGDFVATVRQLIPSYTLDDTTLLYAVVTQFQAGPFVLYVGELAEELEVGETYVFSLEPKEMELSWAQWETLIFDAQKAIERYGLRVDTVRPAEESEKGLDATHIDFEVVE